MGTAILSADEQGRATTSVSTFLRASYIGPYIFVVPIQNGCVQDKDILLTEISDEIWVEEICEVGTYSSMASAQETRERGRKRQRGRGGGGWGERESDNKR